MAIPKLAFSNLTARWVRTALTATAITLSVSLVVAVTSGYASVEGAAFHFVAQYLGTTDATVTRAHDLRGGVPDKVVGALRQDPRVKRVVGRLEVSNDLPVEGTGPDDKTHRVQLVGVDRPSDTQVESLRVESGQWFNSADGDDAVIDQAVAALLKCQVGREIDLPGDERPLRVRVVGIVHKPQLMAESMPTIYVPLHTLQRFAKYGDDVTRVMIEFKKGVDGDKFAADWSPKLWKIDPALKMRLANQARKKMAENLEPLHLASYMGGLVSMTAATFIVFSALSMGVMERQRTLAMLRAIGAFRRQIAGLVLLEGVLLAAIGVLVGVPLGWVWIHVLAWRFPKIFFAGAFTSWGGVLFGAIGTIGAAIIASLLPAWSASRVRPLEAMTPLSKPPSFRGPLVCAVIGLVLIAIDPLLLYGPLDAILRHRDPQTARDLGRVIKFYGHFSVGLPAVMIGFFLLSPVFVRVVEWVFAPILAGLMGLKFALLRQQLSAGIWRAAGTATALMVGLAVLIVLQLEGTTALKGWKLPDKFPDVFIVNFKGMDLADAKKLEDIPGIRRGEMTPIAIASPGLPQGFLGLAGAMLIPDATMFFGVDPDTAFQLMDLEFRDGNAEQARALLKKGRYIVVTNEFKQLRGLGVGDKLPLKTLHGMENYTIAGVVWSPGIDVIVSLFDMPRQMDERTAASVFGTVEDAERDFGIKRFYLFAANLDYGVDKEAVLKEVQHRLKAEGMRAGDVREIKWRIENTFYNLLLLVSTVAFAAMAVASFGVTNTVMASIRTRRWHFGILRSIGVTRSQLLRLVLSEALLLGLVGCVMGIAAGLELAFNAETVSIVVTGYKPPIVIPWKFIGIGSGIVMGVSLLASLWPALHVARQQPLSLLQAGRAST